MEGTVENIQITKTSTTNATKLNSLPQNNTETDATDIPHTVHYPTIPTKTTSAQPENPTYDPN